MNPHIEPAPSDVLAGFGDIDGLRRLAVRLVRDDAEADDVVQESLLLGMRRAAGRVLDLGTWLRGVVRNKARESRRAAGRRQARESEARPGISPMEPIDIAARVEIHDQLFAAVKGLAEPYRSAVWLHYVEGKEASDIARDLGTPVETVRTHIKRGIARLREDLDRRHGGKRAEWVPSLAVFAGVKPALSLIATTTATAGAVSTGKAIAVAAGVLALLGSAFVGLPKLFPKHDDSSIPRSQPGHERAALAARNRDADSPATGTAGTGEAAARRDNRSSIRPKPFAADPTDSAPSSATEGTFSFHYQQGFTFASKNVSDDIESADLVFKSAAGGISSVTLEAPEGAIVSLERFKGALPTLKHAQSLARSVVRAEPAAIIKSGTASGDNREPASDVFVVRTRHGEYVALAIVERSEKGGWTEQPVTIRYVVNESEPVFRPGTGDLTVGGIEVDSQRVAQLEREIEDEAARLREEAERAHQAALEPFKRRLAELDRKAAAMEPGVQAQEGKDVRVAAVLDRGFAAPMGSDDAYVAATYSFAKATRDDVKATRNAWSFLLSSQLLVHLCVDEHSRIWDLGSLSYGNARGGAVPTSPGRDRADVAQGHLYAVHTIDSDTNQWALMRVEELVAGESIIFSWVVLKDASALSAALESGDAVMQSPVARLQIRGGGGGNPAKVFLDRNNEYVHVMSESALDLLKPLDINEKHSTGFVLGGKVPSGMVFMVDRVEYVARVPGDGSGHGAFTLWLGSFPIAHVREARNAESNKKQVRWFGLDRGERLLTVEDMPVRGDLPVRIAISRGQEDQVYAEITNSSWADVTLSGRFVPAAQNPTAVKGKRPDIHMLYLLESLAGAEDAAAVSSIARSINAESATVLRSILESIPAGLWRDQVKSALDQIPR